MGPGPVHFGPSRASFTRDFFLNLPWANVRSDVRSDEVKRKVSWTLALRAIVRNCYAHHSREDLLPEFTDHDTLQQAQYGHQTMVQTINNPDGSLSIIHIDTGNDGTPQVVTLADGTHAQVVHAIHPGGATSLAGSSQEASAAVQTLAEVAAGTQHLTATSSAQQHTGQMVELGDPSLGSQGVATLAEATINQDGQIVFTGGDGGGLAGMVSIPVSVYQTVISSMQQQPQELGQQQVQMTMGAPLGVILDSLSTEPTEQETGI